MSEPRTVGGSLLRSALNEAQKQAFASPTSVTAFVAYDRETGAEVGMAYHWKTEKGSEWAITGSLKRKAVAAQSPYAVRLELRGTL